MRQINEVKGTRKAGWLDRKQERHPKCFSAQKEAGAN